MDRIRCSRADWVLAQRLQHGDAVRYVRERKQKERVASVQATRLHAIHAGE